MSFEIRYNGETIHEVDIDPRLVTGARLHSYQGEAGVAGSPLTGVGNDWVNITLDIQQPTVLPLLEDDARLSNELPEEVLVHNPVAIQAEKDAHPEDEDTEESDSEESELSVG